MLSESQDRRGAGTEVLGTEGKEGLPEQGNEACAQTDRQQQGRGPGPCVRDTQELAEDTVGKGPLIRADMAGVGQMVNTLFTIRPLTVFRMPVKGERKHRRQVNCQQNGGNDASDLFHKRLQRYNINVQVVSVSLFSYQSSLSTINFKRINRRILFVD